MRLLITIGLVLLISSCSSDSKPPADTIFMAAEEGRIQDLGRFVAQQNEIDVADHCAWTPLMKAALNGQTEAVRLLLEAGANPDHEDKGAYTAIMLAASNNHASTVKLLIEQGASINQIENTAGWTALIWSAKQGHMQTVQILLENGADPSIRDMQGNNALDWASLNGHAEVVALLKHPDSE
jgi:ankyrin repeat protein